MKIFEKKIFSLNTQAMNTLFCALDKNKFNRVSIRETTYNIQHTLEVTHKDINRVKESNINLLIHSYELFRMKPSEIISDMYIRFMDVVNGLKVLGKCYTNLKMVNKILKSLSKVGIQR